MAVIWCGGEDIDFPNGTWPVPFDTSTGHFRAGYARGAIGSTGSATFYKSVTFAAQTSAWLSYQVYTSSGFGNTSNKLGGFGKSATNSGLFLSTDTVSGNKAALVKWDAGSATQLAVETAVSLTAGVLHRVDMQVISYGASGTVNIWIDGNLVISFTGSIAASGVTDLDQVWLFQSASFVTSQEYSEIIVSDSDTRTLSLVTMAPSAAGTTDNWTGAYTDVNETTCNDATVVYTNTGAQDEQFGLLDLPAGAFTVQAVMISARASISIGATATTLALGINSGGTIDPGSPQSLTTSWDTYERLMALNPITSSPFTVAEVNALQENLRSGT